MDGASSCTYPQFDLKAKAVYYEGFYNLTGESWANAYKSGAFTSIKPKANFGLGPNGGWGAWQIGLRYSSYEVTEPSYFAYSTTSSLVSTRKNISGSTNTNGFSRGENSTQANTWTLGVNWILNPNARVLINYAETKFVTPVTYLSTSSPSTLGTTSGEKVLSLRTQLNF